MKISVKKNDFYKILFILFLVCGLGFLYFFSVIDLKDILILFILIFGYLNIIVAFINKKRDILSPSTLLPFTFSMYALGPIFYVGTFTETTFLKFLFYQLIGLLSLHLGFLYVETRKKNQSAHQKSMNFSIEQNAFHLTVFIFFGISFLSTISEIYAFGGLGNLIKVGYGSEKWLFLDNARVIGGGFQWLVLSGILIWYYGVKYKNIIYRNIGFIVIFIVSTLLFIIGSRSILFYSVLFFIIIYNYQRKKIKNRVILYFLFFGISFAQFYSFARFYLPNGLYSALNSTFEIIIKDISLVSPVPWNINEFKIPGKSLLEIIEYGGPGLQYGRSYISAIGSPIPLVARVTSSLGFNPSRWLMETYHYEIYLAGGGYGFSPVAEALINFHVIGIIFHMFFYGYFINKVYNNHLIKDNVASLLLLAGSLPIFMLDGLRINTASFLYKLFRIYLMPYIIFQMTYYLLRYRGKNEISSME